MSNTVLLGEIASLKTGPFGTQLSASEYVKEGIPVINVRNIGYGEIITSDLEYVGEETAKRLYEHLLHKGDIVFGRKGSVDRHAFIDTRYDGWMQGSDCIRVRINEGINPHFISHNLKLESVKKQINSSAVGSTMASLNTDILSRIQIVLPSLEIQNRIEELLSVIEEKIDLNSRLCAKLEAMAKTLYDYWFVQFDFPDENGKPYRTSGGAMEWCQELGREVPKGWKVRRLPEVSSVQYGFPLSTEKFSSTGNRVVRIRDIIDNSYSALTNEAVGNEYFTQEDDLLVGMDGNFQMNYWTRNGDIVNQRITRIRKTVIPIMLIKMQIQPYITAKIDTVARSTVGHLGDADFSERYILVPEGLDIDIFDAYLSKIVSLRKENQELSDLRDWLLPMLMNGQAFIH